MYNYREIFNVILTFFWSDFFESSKMMCKANTRTWLFVFNSIFFVSFRQINIYSLHLCLFINYWIDFQVGGIVLCVLGGSAIAFHNNISNISDEFSLNFFEWLRILNVLAADKNVYENEILSVGIVLAVIGAVVVPMTFLGCFGAFSLNKCCLLTVRESLI